ncbi:MAG: helix-turn-helix domain-containing protein [Synergistaceae bacterium]|nr:helix-turn-helix domain-containing protein [Synergistaceae bacterium]
MRDNLSEKQTSVTDDLSELGVHLRSLREAQGLSYDDVAKFTHVRPHILIAIEEGRIYSEAPMVYMRGFIKTYCEFLMAMDLWQKYGTNISSSESDVLAGEKSIGAHIDLKHQTAIFRRSSIIWVYILLVTAVLCAAYLLWSQQGVYGTKIEGFFYRNRGETDEGMRTLPASLDLGSIAISADIPSAEEFGIFSYDVSSAIVSTALPGGPSVPASRSGDLSWMNISGGLPSIDSAMPPATQTESVRARDRRLKIVITGGENNLIVEQNGKVVTRRRLAKGGTREYDVKGDTSVSLSVGNRAEITWFGKKYDQAGPNASPLSLVFHPDGSVSVKSGVTEHFGNNTVSANGNR